MRLYLPKWLFRLHRPAPYLSQARGVVHVGGNTGQERFVYAIHNLDVIWIEPIPGAFDQLCENLRSFPKQRAYRYLITDKNGLEYPFHISNNEGQSSSIFQLEKHKEMWPEIFYNGSIILVSSTLSSFATKERIDLNAFDALVLDTQGSELLVLLGAIDILAHFRFITVEVADFQSYSGCCLLKDMDEFMSKVGFCTRERKAFKSVPGLGTYYDITYERKSVV